MKTFPRFVVLPAVFTVLLMVGVNSWAETSSAPKEKQTVAKQTPPKSPVIATVNGVAIKRVAYEREVDQVLGRFSMQGRPVSAAMRTKLRKDILEQMIRREMLFQESRKRKINIPQAKIDEQINAIKARFDNEEQFNQRLNVMDITLADLTAQISQNMAIDQLLRVQFPESITLPEAEVRKYYDDNQDRFFRPEQVKASHILVKVEPKASEVDKQKALQKIKMIQTKLNSGEDFAAVAKAHSEGPSGPKGGDLGTFSRGQMVPPFEQAAFALNSGQVSDVVTTRFGYHLIKVFEKHAGGAVPFEQVKSRLAAQLKQQKGSEQVRQYADTLLKAAKIERFDEP